jgi:trigger factor
MPTAKHVFNNDTHTVVLSLELSVAEYLPKVEKKLKEYRNKVQLKGFRTGEVPMSFLKAKFGTSILVEEIQGIINDELNTFIETSKLNVVGSPLPNNKYDASIQKPKDIKIDIEIGFVPDFEIEGVSSEFALPFYSVMIDDETLEKEIDSQRKKLSQDFEEGVSDVQDGDTLRVTLREAEEGAVKPEGLVKDETYINLDKAASALKNELLNKKIGDKLIVSLADLDSSVTLKKAKKLHFALTARQTCSDDVEIEILEIKRVKKRELNAEFFKELFQNEELEDETAFRNRLRSAISESFESAVFNIFNRSIFEHLMEQNKNLPIPVAFLRRFVEETQLKGKKIEDDQFNELLKQLIWGTLTQDLCKKYDVNVTQQDVEYEMRMAIVRYYGFQISPFHNLFDEQVKKMMEEKETYRKYYEEVQESKLFAALENEFSKETRTVNSDEFKEVYEQHFAKQQAKDDADADKLEEILDIEEV